MDWQDDQAPSNGICQFCGCDEAQAGADATAIGLADEFEAGVYTCCQVVAWADEQWLAWRTAAVEDGNCPEDVTLPLEIRKATEQLVPVCVRKTRLEDQDSTKL